MIPNLTKKLKGKLQVIQNKCIGFCLKLKCRQHITNEHFEKLNWPPINQSLNNMPPLQYSNMFKTNT